MRVITAWVTEAMPQAVAMLRPPALEGAHLFLKGGERGIATSQVGAVHRGRLVDRRRRGILRLTRVNAARNEPVILIHAFVLFYSLMGRPRHPSFSAYTNAKHRVGSPGPRLLQTPFDGPHHAVDFFPAVVEVGGYAENGHIVDVECYGLDLLVVPHLLPDL